MWTVQGTVNSPLHSSQHGSNVLAFSLYKVQSLNDIICSPAWFGAYLIIFKGDDKEYDSNKASIICKW